MEHYYVYAYIDPRSNIPFYVGKGHGRRSHHHLGETETTTENIQKFKIIQEIRASGLEPIIEIIKDFLSSSDAHRLEDKLIKLYGRKGLDEGGILSNRNIGSKDGGSYLLNIIEDKDLVDLQSLQIDPKIIATKYNVSLGPVYNLRPRVHNRLSSDDRSEIRESREPTKYLAERFGVSPQTIVNIRGRLRGRLSEDNKELIRSGKISAESAASEFGVCLSAAQKYLPHGTKKWKFDKSTHDYILESSKSIAELSRYFGLSADIVSAIKSGNWLTASIPKEIISYIYVISSSKNGPCKIGMGADVERRLKQLQTGNADILRVFHQEPISSKQVHLMEQVVHRENRHRKIKGEWFNMSVEDAILEVRHAMIRFEEEVETRAQFIPKNQK